MKRSLAATALVGAMALAGCSQQQAEEASAAPEAALDAAAPMATPAPAAGSAPTLAAAPAAAGAPAFAVLYPGGVADGPPTLAQSPAGPGGIVNFTTDAAPEAVVAFYRDRAEAAGLKPINTMSRGNSAGYAAGDGVDGKGQLLSVVATRVEGEPTSVQLSWSAGR